MFSDKITSRLIEDVKKVKKKREEAPLVSRDKLPASQVPPEKAPSSVNDVKPNTVVSIGQGTSRVNLVTGKPQDNAAALRQNPDAPIEKSMPGSVTIIPRVAKSIFNKLTGKKKS